jgi:hypothetical protein
LASVTQKWLYLAWKLVQINIPLPPDHQSVSKFITREERKKGGDKNNFGISNETNWQRRKLESNESVIRLTLILCRTTCLAWGGRWKGQKKTFRILVTVKVLTWNVIKTKLELLIFKQLLCLEIGHSIE